jgi:hypothetical protein
LDKKNASDAFTEFLQLRASAIHTILSIDSQHANNKHNKGKDKSNKDKSKDNKDNAKDAEEEAEWIKEKLCDVVEVVKSTLYHVLHLFHSTAERSALLQTLLTPILKESNHTSHAAIDTASLAIPLEDIRTQCAAWIKACAAAVHSNAKTLLLHIRKAQHLKAIQHSILQAIQAPFATSPSTNNTNTTTATTPTATHSTTSTNATSTPSTAPTASSSSTPDAPAAITWTEVSVNDM